MRVPRQMEPTRVYTRVSMHGAYVFMHFNSVFTRKLENIVTGCMQNIRPLYFVTLELREMRFKQINVHTRTRSIVFSAAE